MTEEERSVLVNSVVCYWLPASWSNNGHRYNVESVMPVGDVEEGEVRVVVGRNDSIKAVISFTNNECYGGVNNAPSLGAGAARTRVYNGTYA